MSLDIGASHVWPRTSARLLSAPPEGRGERESRCRRSDPNVPLLGPPGAGTSRLARRLTTILPAMSLAEALDTTRMPRVAGLTGGRTAPGTPPPCPAPHHTPSGGGGGGGGP